MGMADNVSDPLMELFVLGNENEDKFNRIVESKEGKNKKKELFDALPEGSTEKRKDKIRYVNKIIYAWTEFEKAMITISNDAANYIPDDDIDSGDEEPDFDNIRDNAINKGLTRMRFFDAKYRKNNGKAPIDKFRTMLVYASNNKANKNLTFAEYADKKIVNFKSDGIKSVTDVIESYFSDSGFESVLNEGNDIVSSIINGSFDKFSNDTAVANALVAWNDFMKQFKEYAEMGYMENESEMDPLDSDTYNTFKALKEYEQIASSFTDTAELASQTKKAIQESRQKVENEKAEKKEKEYKKSKKGIKEEENRKEVIEKKEELSERPTEIPKIDQIIGQSKNSISEEKPVQKKTKYEQSATDLFESLSYVGIGDFEIPAIKHFDSVMNAISISQDRKTREMIGVSAKRIGKAMVQERKGKGTASFTISEEKLMFDPFFKKAGLSLDDNTFAGYLSAYIKTAQYSPKRIEKSVSGSIANIKTAIDFIVFRQKKAGIETILEDEVFVANNPELVKAMNDETYAKEANANEIWGKLSPDEKSLLVKSYTLKTIPQDVENYIRAVNDGNIWELTDDDIDNSKRAIENLVIPLARNLFGKKSENMTESELLENLSLRSDELYKKIEDSIEGLKTAKRDLSKAETEIRANEKKIGSKNERIDSLREKYEKIKEDTENLIKKQKEEIRQNLKDIKELYNAISKLEDYIATSTNLRNRLKNIVSAKKLDKGNGQYIEVSSIGKHVVRKLVTEMRKVTPKNIHDISHVFDVEQGYYLFTNTDILNSFKDSLIKNGYIQKMDGDIICPTKSLSSISREFDNLKKEQMDTNRKINEKAESEKRELTVEEKESLVKVVEKTELEKIVEKFLYDESIDREFQIAEYKMDQKQMAFDVSRSLRELGIKGKTDDEVDDFFIEKNGEMNEMKSNQMNKQKSTSYQCLSCRCQTCFPIKARNSVHCFSVVPQSMEK